MSSQQRAGTIAREINDLTTHTLYHKAIRLMHLPALGYVAALSKSTVVAPLQRGPYTT